MGFGIAQVFRHPDVQPLFQCHLLWLLVGSSVYFRGEKIFTAGMEEDAEYLFYIDGNEGIVIPYTGAVDRSDYNLIRVQGGSVCVLSADCPDKTCIYLGERTWGEILCMAHEMMIRVEGGGLETDI